jgi:hypothetical protein
VAAVVSDGDGDYGLTVTAVTADGVLSPQALVLKTCT